MMSSHLSRKRVQNYVYALAIGDSHYALDKREISAREDVLFINAILFHKELIPVSSQYVAHILRIIEHTALFSGVDTVAKISAPIIFERLIAACPTPPAAAWISIFSPFSNLAASINP